MFSLIFSITFIVLAVIAALIGFLTGKKYRWQYSVVKIVITAISAIVATFASALIASLIAEPLVSLVLSFFKGIAIVNDLSAISAEILTALFCILVSPILFYPVFALTRGLLNIAKRPLAKLFVRITTKKGSVADIQDASGEEISKKQARKLRRLAKKKDILYGKFSPIGAILGALCGVMTFFIISIPLICGTAYLATPAAAVTANINNDKVQLVHEISVGAENNVAVTTMKYVGGEAVFNRLTTHEVNGHDMSLKNEMVFVTTCIDAFNTIRSSSSAETYNGAANAQGLKKIGEEFGNTTLLPSVLPEVLNLANGRWEKGEKFFGIGKPSFGENVDPLIDTLIDVLSQENYDTIKQDLPVIINSVADVAEKYPLSTIKSSPMTVIGDEEMCAKVFGNILENDRLYVVVPAITECGMGIICDKLALNVNFEEEYDQMNAALADEIDLFIEENKSPAAPSGENTGSGTPLPTDDELAKKLSKKLGKIFNNGGINITSDSLLEVSADALITFNDGNVSAEAVEQWLANTTITVADLEGKTTDIILKDEAVFAEFTQIVDMDSFKINREKAADPRKEAALLAHSFKVLTQIFDKLTGSEKFELNSMLTDLGPMLNDFSSMHMIGSENTSTLLMGILQSDKVTDNVDITKTEIYDIGSHINNSANEKTDEDDTPKYDELMSGLSSTIKVIESAKGEDKEKTVEDVKELIENLTPASASTIQKVATPSVMENYGVPEKSAEPTADLVSDVFGNLSDAKVSGDLTEEQYEAESKAVSDMMNIAINAATNTDKPIFGEGSSTGITATEFVDRITESTVVSQTLVDTVYGDGDTPKYNPLNSDKKLSEADQAEVVDALNNKLNTSSEEEKEALTKNLIAAASILNLPVELTSAGFTIISAQ